MKFSPEGSVFSTTNPMNANNHLLQGSTSSISESTLSYLQFVRWFDSARIEVQNGSKTKELTKAVYKITYEKVSVVKKSHLLVKELKLVSILQNESILRFLGASDTYLVFQKWEVTLDCVIANQQMFSTTDASLALLNIAQALAFIHTMGYVHGNVSRKNIVFTEKFDGRFYEAKLANVESVYTIAEARKKKNCGAQMRFQEWNLSPSSDVMSLGIVTLETFTRWTVHVNSSQQPEFLHFDLCRTLLNEDAGTRFSANDAVQLFAEGLQFKPTLILKPKSEKEVRCVKVDVTKSSVIRRTIHLICQMYSLPLPWTPLTKIIKFVEQ